MTEYQVIIEPEAEDAMYARAEYIAIKSGSKAVGQRYYNGIYAFCQSLSLFPQRSEKRNDLYPNLHVTNYRGTDIVAYEIDENTKTVHITADS